MKNPFSTEFVTSLLIGHTSEVKLINLEDGTTIRGSRNLKRRSLQLKLPSGEILEGHYVPLTTSNIGTGSMFSKEYMTTTPWSTTGHSFRGYARLTGRKGELLEIVFSSEWTGRGNGFAKTNDGGNYEVIL